MIEACVFITIIITILGILYVDVNGFRAIKTVLDEEGRIKEIEQELVNVKEILEELNTKIDSECLTPRMKYRILSIQKSIKRFNVHEITPEELIIQVGDTCVCEF